MALQGLDRAAAPAPDKAKQMLDAISGGWWNVYVGGPESGGSGWTPALVNAYVKQGIRHFMLTYVGRQWNGPLTRKQGQADAADALALAQKFGYSGAFPLCLDVELKTYETSASGALAYAGAWCDAVRAAGVRPGVYANPEPVKAMANAHVAADFVWVCSWVSHSAGQRDPHAAPGVPGSLWGNPGQRAWQYAGAYNNTPCRVGGLDVDINVADPGCLAGPPGQQKQVDGKPPKFPGRPLKRGSWGDDVERWQQRMKDRGWRIDVSGRYDADSERVCSGFQKEKQLDVTGAVDRKTWAATWRAPVTP
jgi:hypothetical protein